MAFPKGISGNPGGRPNDQKPMLARFCLITEQNPKEVMSERKKRDAFSAWYVEDTLDDYHWFLKKSKEAKSPQMQLAFRERAVEIREKLANRLGLQARENEEKGNGNHVNILALIQQPGILELAERAAAFIDPGESGAAPLQRLVDVRPAPEAPKRAGDQAGDGHGQAGHLDPSPKVG